MEGTFESQGLDHAYCADVAEPIATCDDDVPAIVDTDYTTNARQPAGPQRRQDQSPETDSASASQIDVTLYATSEEDVYAGVPLVGTLFKINATGKPRWLCHLLGDQTHTIEHVVQRHRGGDFKLVPPNDHHDIYFTAGIDEVQTSIGGKPSTPMAGSAYDEDRAFKKAQTLVQEKVEDLRERLTNARQDNADFNRKLSEANEALVGARSEIAALEGQASRTRMELENKLSTVRMEHADVREKLVAAHFRELEKLKGDLREAEAESKILNWRIDHDQGGEGHGFMEKVLDFITESGLASDLAEAIGQGVTAGRGNPLHVQDHEYPDATEGEASIVEQFIHTSVRLALQAALGQKPYGPEQVAEQIMDWKQHVESLGHPIRTAEWQGLARTMLLSAVENAIPAPATARYLLPIIEPFIHHVQPILALGAAGLPIIGSYLGMPLDETSRPYLVDVLAELSAAIAPPQASVPDQNDGEGEVEDEIVFSPIKPRSMPLPLS